MDPTEKEDFLDVIKNRGFSPSDFSFEEEDVTRASSGIYAIRSTISITCLRTGISRKYQAGHGTAWVVAFEEDLRANAYNTKQ